MVWEMKCRVRNLEQKLCQRIGINFLLLKLIKNTEEIILFIDFINYSCLEKLNKENQTCQKNTSNMWMITYCCRKSCSRCTASEKLFCCRQFTSVVDSLILICSISCQQFTVTVDRGPTILKTLSLCKSLPLKGAVDSSWYSKQWKWNFWYIDYLGSTLSQCAFDHSRLEFMFHKKHVLHMHAHPPWHTPYAHHAHIHMYAKVSICTHYGPKINIYNAMFGFERVLTLKDLKIFGSVSYTHLTLPTIYSV